MKKILMSIMTAAFVAISTVSALAANNSSVEIKNDSQTVTYDYAAGSDTETLQTVTKLFNKIKDITEEKTSVTQVITLTSKISNSAPMNFSLRMTDASEYADDEEISVDNSVLTYYNVTVTDSKGDIIAQTDAGADDIEETEDGILVKNIDLGNLNTQFTKETKIYNIEISVPEELTEEQISEAKENIEWDLVCISAKAAEEKRILKEEAAAEPESTEAAEEENIPENDEATQAPSTQAPVTQTPVATALAATAAPSADAKGVKYVGEEKDIIPGRYTVTGNGLVKVYNSSGELKTNILLTDGKSDSDGGIASYVLNLADGDRVEISDYINLKPYSTETAAPKAKATATPKAAVAASATAAPKATAKPADKTNPKTGDTAPVAAVSAIAVLALGVCIFIEASKRKKN